MGWPYSQAYCWPELVAPMAGKVAQASTVDGGVVNGGAVNGGAVNSGVMNGGVDRLLEGFHILA